METAAEKAREPVCESDRRPVHMGGGGAGYVESERLYHDSIELGLRRPNIRFILSALRENYIEEALIRFQLAGHAFRRSPFCASDARYGRMAWTFGGFPVAVPRAASARKASGSAGVHQCRGV